MLLEDSHSYIIDQFKLQTFSSIRYNRTSTTKFNSCNSFPSPSALLTQFHIQEFNAKLSDFGLARDGPTGDRSHVSSRIVGTQGYAAPEYVSSGHLTVKSDVYSFGVVLLEILSGRRAMEKDRTVAERNLVDWARPLLSCRKKLLRIMDTRLEGCYSNKGAYIVAKVAEKCLDLQMKNRPDMANVADILEQIQQPQSIQKFFERLHPDNHINGPCRVHPTAKTSLNSSDVKVRKPLLIKNPSTNENLHEFNLDALSAATEDFSDDRFIGEGGFGIVYKGWIKISNISPEKPGSQSQQGKAKPVNKAVAVKKLALGGYQGHDEWRKEIDYLSRLHHPNIVTLVGYSIKDEQRLLVYEFMENGSLDNHLFARMLITHCFFLMQDDAASLLPWAKRITIALGAARGLAFLHDASIIFRDMKASNILLDKDFNAKLSDFGLARDGPIDDRTHVSTKIIGTHGYAAPEYVESGHLTKKADVYSFGIVMLELLSGRPALMKRGGVVKEKIANWAKVHYHTVDDFIDLMDRKLMGQYGKREAKVFTMWAIQCINPDKNQRPEMSLMVNVLEQLQKQLESRKG
ncbi:putative serine/threonine-protein kinase [Nymphaea thermarum]|nr:putative serine/threonine-protein kinase [Nymphaea thermarum]